ncbi:MAG: cyclic nucleotide-binding domain-containing protein, partial [Ilumatobacter sp.]
ALRGALMGAVMLAALLTVVLGLRLEVPVVFVVLPAIGVCMAVMDALSRTLLQRSTDPRQLGPLFAVIGLVAAAGQIAGSLLAQVTLALGDVRLALTALGAVLAALAVFSVTSLRRADDEAHVPVSEMALMSGLPMLASVPSPVLERVARAAETTPVEPGASIVEERQRVDSCFVVVDGEFEVTSNGRSLRTVGRGAVIGEVGLLAGIASMTSVCAVSSGAVLRIAREPFLTALTGHDTNRGTSGEDLGDGRTESPDHSSARSRFRTAIAEHRRHATSHDGDHADVWLGLGAAGRAFGDLTFLEAIERGAAIAEASGDDLMLAEAASLTTVQGFFFILADNVDPAMTDVCERALARLDSDDPARVRVLAALASNLSFSGDHERRVHLIAEANRLASEHGEPILEAIALNAEFVSRWEPGTLDRREVIADRLIDLASELGDAEIEFIGEFFAGYCAVERGCVEDAHVRLVRLRRLVPATGIEYFDFLVERFILAIDIARGASELAQRVDALAARHADSHADTDGTWALQVGGIAIQSGRLDTMIPVISTMLDGPHSNTWRAGLAIAHLMAGDDDAAGRVLDEQGPIRRSYFWMSVMQCRAEVAAHLGRTELCARLFAELAPYRGRVGIASSGTLVVGLVSRSLGELAAALGRTDEAVELLTEAIRDADELEMTFEATVARRLLAGVRSATGDAAAASALAEEARATADLHGFEREARLARELIDRPIRTPRTPGPHDPVGRVSV